MALIHADNFNIYGSGGTGAANMLDGVYAQVVNTRPATDPDGISTPLCLYIEGAHQSNTEGIRYVLNDAAIKCGIAMRVWLPSLTSGTTPTPIFFQWRNAGNSSIFTILPDTTGRLVAKTGEYNGSTVGTTTNPVITAGGWYHIEAMIDTSAKTCEIRVEGIPVLELTELTLDSSVYQVFTGVRTSNTSATHPYYIKDYVVWDGTGDYNNDFLGSVLVHSLLPTADEALNWTPSTGTEGYSILDNVPPNDSEYILAEDDPLPSPYVCSLSDLPEEVTSVKGLITFVRAAKSDGGDGSLQVGVISDPEGTPQTALGTDRPITIAQTYWRDVLEEDPKTEAAWLPAAVNAAHLQLDRTT